jgi:hypothetical protein
VLIGRTTTSAGRLLGGSTIGRSRARSSATGIPPNVQHGSAVWPHAARGGSATVTSSSKTPGAVSAATTIEAVLDDGLPGGVARSAHCRRRNAESLVAEDTHGVACGLSSRTNPIALVGHSGLKQRSL